MKFLIFIGLVIGTSAHSMTLKEFAAAPNIYPTAPNTECAKGYVEVDRRTVHSQWHYGTTVSAYPSVQDYIPTTIYRTCLLSIETMVLDEIEESIGKLNSNNCKDVEGQRGLLIRMAKLHSENKIGTRAKDVLWDLNTKSQFICDAPQSLGGENNAIK